MKLYITYIDGVWGEPTFRGDLENVPKEQYNAEGIFDLEPNAGPESDLDMVVTHKLYLDSENIARYEWTKTRKTGAELDAALQEKWVLVRFTRNKLLTDTDYTQLQDSPFSQEERVAWAAYRSQLRDITSQQDPFNIVWPTNPLGVTSGNIGVYRV